MAKKNTKELLAERNPLQRTLVEPVDIYAQSNEQTQQKLPTAKKKVTSPLDDPLRPYSTYLRRSQVKNIKRHAVEREIKDMLIMQEAVDEYLKKHPL